MSEPILELPGITVTRESIETEGRKLPVDIVRRVPIRKTRVLLPRKIVRPAMVAATAPFWYTVIFWQSLTTFSHTSMSDIVIALLYPVFGLVALTLVVSLGAVIVYGRKHHFWVQLESIEGTFTALKTRDRQQAEQVKQAIEEALGDTTSSPLPGGQR